MYMNEENGLKGALEYAKIYNEKGEFHLAGIESDRGGFSSGGDLLWKRTRKSLLLNLNK